MPLTPTQKKRVRTHITSYCLRAEANERAWHYSQQRPYHFVANPAAPYVVADCSSYVAVVFHDAMNDLGIWLADPLGMRWSGYGYTGTEEAWLREHGKRVREVNGFIVGDVAVYDGHTTVCRKAGSAGVALWSSHGSEGGPRPVKLGYRDDLVGCWRHPALL